MHFDDGRPRTGEDFARALRRRFAGKILLCSDSDADAGVAPCFDGRIAKEPVGLAALRSRA